MDADMHQGIIFVRNIPTGQMLIRLFQSKSVANSVLLLGYALLLRVVYVTKGNFWTVEIKDTQGIYQYLIELFSGEWSQLALSSSLCFLHALLVNRLVVQHRLTKSLSFLPGLFYISLSSLLPQFFELSAELVATTFLLLSADRAFRLYNQVSVSDTYFAGFWGGFSFLFFTPLYLWVVFLWLSLMILRPFTLREYLQVTLGFLTPLYLYISIHYLNGTVHEHVTYLGSVIQIVQVSVVGTVWMIIVSFFYLTVLALSIMQYGLLQSKTNVAIQKKVDLLYWWILFSGISVFFTNNLDLHHWILTFVPISVFLTKRIDTVKRLLFWELLVWVMVLVSIITQVNS